MIIFELTMPNKGLGRKNKDKPDSYFDSKEYVYRKYMEMAKHKDIIFKIIAQDIEDKVEREVIESNYAHKTKALYWNPAPVQRKRI